MSNLVDSLSNTLPTQYYGGKEISTVIMDEIDERVLKDTEEKRKRIKMFGEIRLVIEFEADNQTHRVVLVGKNRATGKAEAIHTWRIPTTNVVSQDRIILPAECLMIGLMEKET